MYFPWKSKFDEKVEKKIPKKLEVDVINYFFRDAIQNALIKGYLSTITLFFLE